VPGGGRPRSADERLYRIDIRLFTAGRHDEPVNRLEPLALGAATLALVCVSGASARQSAGTCRGGQLSGSFAVVRGSAGAGNVSYALVLRNRSRATCSLSGLPSGRLLGKAGGPLPTRIRAAFPGAQTAILVRLVPRGRAHATARFSPDVPGVGEPTQGTRCERTAYRLRVNAPGGGTTTVPIVPPTPVCEHGQLQFSTYAG
jgi:Domain of unknown function (DUF4232)